MDRMEYPYLSESQPLLRCEREKYEWRSRLSNCCDVRKWVKILTFILTGLLLVAVILYLVVFLRGKLEGGLSPIILKRVNAEISVEEGKTFEKAWKEGEQIVAERRKLEKMLYDQGVMPKIGSPTSLLQLNFRKKVRYQRIKNCAIITEHLRRTFGECVKKDVLPSYCESGRPSRCDENFPYRSYNGSCNNLKHPYWGMAQTPYSRIIRPHYADDVSSPRSSIDGSDLPNPRVLSNKIYSHKFRPDSNSTLMAMVFGLFIDHDIVSTARQTGKNFTAITCCDRAVIEKPVLRHPECYPIEIPETDSFYGPLGITCLDFVRSSPLNGKCPGQREQMNLVTSFLDGSAIYGSSYAEAKNLRAFHKGEMMSTWVNHTELLPQDNNSDVHCGTYRELLTCFKAGDNRVNMQESLTTMHTIWLREHNRIARILSMNNHSWDDETVFQESRKVVIAEIQNIAFKELLPLWLGEEAVQHYDLKITEDRIYDRYDETLDPSIYNVFPTAALRFGHSLIQGKINLYGDVNQTDKRILLRETFFNMDVIYKDGLDPMLRGLVSERSQAVDSFITAEVRNHLFQSSVGKSGLDLTAIGIQRGRDHGLPGYPTWRKACGLSTVETWDDLRLIMPDHHISRFKDVYRFVDDIDLIPGALSEYHAPGSLLGQTHICLLGKQFHKIRATDRFWFENTFHKGAFSKDQLQEIYKSSISRIICDNSENIRTIQRHAFKVLSEANPLMDCCDIPEVNLTLWTKKNV